MEGLTARQAELYRTRDRGLWVVHVLWRWWLVPALAGGWERRRLYRGRVSDLREVRGATAQAGLRLVGLQDV